MAFETNLSFTEPQPVDSTYIKDSLKDVMVTDDTATAADTLLTDYNNLYEEVTETQDKLERASTTLVEEFEDTGVINDEDVKYIRNQQQVYDRHLNKVDDISQRADDVVELLIVDYKSVPMDAQRNLAGSIGSVSEIQDGCEFIRENAQFIDNWLDQ